MIRPAIHWCEPTGASSLVAHGGTIRAAARLARMPRAGPGSLPRHETVPGGRAIWSRVAGPPGGVLGGCQYRRWVSAQESARVPPVSRYRPCVTLRSGVRTAIRARGGIAPIPRLENARQASGAGPLSHLAAISLAQVRLASTLPQLRSVSPMLPRPSQSFLVLPPPFYCPPKTILVPTLPTTSCARVATCTSWMVYASTALRSETVRLSTVPSTS